MVARLGTIHAYVTADAATRTRVSAVLERAGRAVVFVDRASLADRLASIEVLVCGSTPALDWSPARRLRLLQVLGSGIEGLRNARGLPAHTVLANARGMHLPEMRDHALALLLAFARELPTLLEAQRARCWSPRAASTLSGKTVAILGLGAVGLSVAAACGALGMHVVGTRARPAPTPGVAEVFAPDAVLEILPRADYVLVLLPLTDATVGSVGRREIAAMRADAVLVHLSRGGIVDEAALVEALRAGRLRGAAVDLFASEPLPASSPLWDVPNLLVTPHVAGLVERYIERGLAVFLENLARVERGEPPLSFCDPARGY